MGILTLTTIPKDFGTGGSGLTPNGSSLTPSLYTLLAEHKAALAALDAALASTTGAGFVLETIGLEWGATNSVGEENAIDDPRVVPFADISSLNLVARLVAHVKVSGGTGTFNVRIGGTLGIADGTIIATGTTVSTTYTKVIFSGSSFANPGGNVLLQITLKDNTVGQTAWIKGASVELLPA